MCRVLQILCIISTFIQQKVYSWEYDLENHMHQIYSDNINTNAYYQELKPYIFANGGNLEGIIPDMLRNVKEECKIDIELKNWMEIEGAFKNLSFANVTNITQAEKDDISMEVGLSILISLQMQIPRQEWYYKVPLFKSKGIFQFIYFIIYGT